MNNPKILLLVLLIILFISGCARTQYLEKIGLTIAVGFDQLKDDRLLGTIVYHQFDPEEKKPVKVMASTALTSKGIRQSINLESNKKLVSGQIRLAVYGEETAKKGIIDLVDSMARDPAIGSLMYIAVAEGEANSLLTYDYKKMENIGSYLYETIKQNIDGEQLISPTLHDFLYDYYSDGKDPILPYIKKEGEEVKIIGTAVFSEDKMVGILPPQDTFYVKLIRDRFETGLFEISIPAKEFKQYFEGHSKQEKDKIDKIYLALDNIRSKSKIKLVDRDPEQLKFKVSLKISTRIMEVSEEMDLSEKVLLDKVEQSVEKCLEDETLKLIKKLQKMGSDPLGFGIVYESSVRRENVSKGNWIELFKKAEFDVDIDLNVITTGVLK